MCKAAGLRGAEYQRALLAFEAHDFGEATNILRRLRAFCGTADLRELVLESQIYKASRRPVSACETLRHALKRYGNTNDARLGLICGMLGETAFEFGDISTAVNAFRQVAKLECNPIRRLAAFSRVLCCMGCQSHLTPDDWQRAYAEYRALVGEVAAYPRQRYGHQRLRVGYLSSGLRNHVTVQVAFSLLYHFDVSRFEVFCYAANAEDAVSAALRKLRLTWRNVHNCTHAETANIIRDDEIDILVDLDGHTTNTALPVFFWQPAAIQLSGLGHVGSTGLLNVDGLISDVYCSPSERSPYGTEPLLRLPRTHWCYTPPSAFPDIAPEPPCLRNGFITFGCFNNCAKLNSETLALWQHIMERVPQSRLLLKSRAFNNDESRQYTLQRFQQLGFDTSRLECRGFSVGSEDYRGQYNDMDIALDTSPYCGGLTTCEALYMGVPVLTLMGERHGSRFGFSMLSNLGLGDLVARTPGAYVELAVAMSQSPEFVLALHQRLRGLMSRSPLMDGVGYAQDVGAMYERVYQAKMGGASCLSC